MKLEFKHVTKRYSEVAAVREVNCVMEQGIYGLLGVNGAGKTTLMRMLCTIIQPSEGEILWNGKEIWKLGSAYREVLGYLPQEFGYYPDLNVYDYMMYISSIKGLKQAFANRRIKHYTQRKGKTIIQNETAAYQFGKDKKAWLPYTTTVSAVRL